MRRHWNNKGRFSSIILLISLSVTSFLIYNLALGYYQAKYTESAHGNSPSGVGVDRTGLKTPIDFGYAVGNCTHCHEQKASIGGAEPAPTGGPDVFLLFAPNNPTSQNNNFCFQCHRGAGSVQYPSGIPYANDDYGSQFGGGTANSTNIKDAFAYGPPVGATPASSHNLNYIQLWWSSKAAGDWVTTNTNACVVCHPPHYAQKNHDPYTTYKTAVRRPSHPSSGVGKPRNLWGDEAGSEYNEMMSEYTTKYQAPQRVGKTTYEPAGQVTPTDGSNLPNFALFCLTCHDTAVPSTREDAPKTGLNIIEWAVGTGVAPYDRHGKRVGWKNNMGGTVKAPYTESSAGGYCLSCTDCHEPHGSPNLFLLRTTVNGTSGITVTAGPDTNDYRLYYFCQACHNITNHAWGAGEGPTTNCTQNGACHMHRAIFQF